MAANSQTGSSSHKQCDVLVVGAGPSGLMTSLILARCGIKDLVIIDKRANRVRTGHASGLQPRSLEILHTVGILQDLLPGAGAVVETAFWGPQEDGKGIQRTSLAREITVSTPYRHLVVQHQGRTELVFGRELEKRGHSIQRPFQFMTYQLTADEHYPIEACIKNVIKGTVETWRCKYIVAADGANSVVRRASQLKSTTYDSSDSYLVAEASVETDFPDFRRKAAIRTPHGNAMVIPHPHARTRFYMMMSADDVDELSNSHLMGIRQLEDTEGNMTTLLDILQRRLPPVFHPYQMEVKDVEWISRYVVGQSVLESFSDRQRVFFVGDSSHSHSPKAAQGMNTGLQDGYNLAWKLALVVKGRARPSLLETYDHERRHIAEQLIDFDHRFAKLFGSKGKANSPEFTRMWRENQGFTSGCGQLYPQGLLVNGTGLADISDVVEPLTPGKRFLPMQLVRHIDGWEVSSLSDMPANDRFVQVLFVGDISKEPRKTDFEDLYASMTSSTSPATVYNHGKDALGAWGYEDIHHEEFGNVDKAIDVLAVHTADHLSIELRPQFEEWKYRFYEDKDGVEHRQHGVDPDQGMVVALIRPDGIVGMISKADNMLEEQHSYLSAFLFTPT